MKKITCAICIVSGLILCILVGKTTANGISDEDNIIYGKKLVIRFYKDWESGNEKKIKSYFVNISENELRYMIATRKDHKITKIDYIESSIVSHEPLIINIIVKEWYKPREIPPYMEFLFIIKNIKGNVWKIVDITEPGLP